jgi:choline-phosphate cytidylyltransferase
MVKVITYGTYDLLHYGHIKLLERAKALGDYLVVGVTTDDFDRIRGKINVQQSLLERVEAVRQTGLADEILIEEYEGQKIDDIKRLGIDIFTVGSDWVGKFDYLNEFCKVVYLDRTQGVSSTDIRSQRNLLNLGISGDAHIIDKFIRESKFVNGIHIKGIHSHNIPYYRENYNEIDLLTDDYDELLNHVDALYIVSHPTLHYNQIKKALIAGKHVLCESPIALSVDEANELSTLANRKGLQLVEGIKTAYSTAYSRMILLAKGGKIGDIVSVDAVCTSLRRIDYADDNWLSREWNSMTSWGPTALLPIFQLLGTHYSDIQIYSRIGCQAYNFDEFTKIAFLYPSSVASIKVGKGVKSEGELIISGTKGYIYVPAPWWKTDYFEIRFENPADNRRYFYQLDGEGIRNEIVSFVRAIDKSGIKAINEPITEAIAGVMESYHKGNKVIKL